jgi:hypothetical protein
MSIREGMVKNALTFLSNPSIKDTTALKKVSFLRNKGLTDLEIEAGFNSAGMGASYKELLENPDA